MLDHIGFPVRDFATAKAFYIKVFAPLGYSLQMEVTPEMSGGGSHAGFGPPGKPDFWIGDAAEALIGRLHIAFTAKSRAAVDAFYNAAIAAGAKDNGKPGLRPHYHEHYYGAFVIDPDGHNIEAVCHAPA
jgi:catechol 2,3-dioxygenase-like lactoylglutathione lyase family enzyme